jgi:hypothetical protein
MVKNMKNKTEKTHILLDDRFYWGFVFGMVLGIAGCTLAAVLGILVW